MKLLLVLNQLLYPADTGGKIRSSSMFERVAREHEVAIVALARPTDTDEQINQMARVCRRLDLVPWVEVTKRSPRFWLDLVRNQVQPYPYMVARYHHQPLSQRVAELVEELRPDVVVCDFLQPSLNVVDLPFRPKVLFQHNVEAQIGQRHYERASNPLAKLFWGAQWRKLRAYEGSAMKRFDQVVTVSEADSAMMASEYGVSHTTAVPLGVDTDAFAPSTEPPLPGRLVFTGSMDWLPNEDGTAWFVGEVLPLIRARRPDVTLSTVGRNATPKVQALAGEGVVVTGSVPDVKPYVREAEVVVVPLRIGGGTRIKTFEAMAMGCGIVSTTLGAEGLPVEHEGDLLLADDAETFAAAVLRLLDDSSLRARLGAAGRAKMVADYSWDKAARVFIEACEKALRSSRGEG